MRTATQIQAEINSVRAAGQRMNRLQNEGGEGYNHTNTTRLLALADELTAVQDAEWTAEITQSRRAAYNTAIKAAAVKRLGL